MSLDDFINNARGGSESNEPDLSNNTPPGDAENWASHEPDVPKWVSYTTSEVKTAEGGKFEGEKVLDIRMCGVATAFIASPHNVRLENYR